MTLASHLADDPRAGRQLVEVVVEHDGAAHRVTVGPPFIAVWPCVTWTWPLAPVSEEPMASLTTRLGNRSRNWSLTLGENTAAVDASANSDEVS